MPATITRLFMGAALGCALAVPAQANNIQYGVHQVQGPASVTGYITTDGALGAIGAADVIDWHLLLDDGVSTYTLTHLNSQVDGDSSWIASPSQLSFDFGGTGLALFQNPVIGSSKHYFCLDSWVGGCGGAYSAIDWRVDGALIVIPASGGGLQPIATAVPEPAGAALLLAGLGLLGWRARRRP